jgi:hypothetical protein
MSFSVLAVLGGAGTFLRLKRTPEYENKLGARYPLAIAACMISVVLGMVHPLILLAAGLLGGAAVLSR